MDGGFFVGMFLAFALIVTFVAALIAAILWVTLRHWIERRRIREVIRQHELSSKFGFYQDSSGLTLE